MYCAYNEIEVNHFEILLIDVMFYLAQKLVFNEL